jgi:hypothetical protein|tara:strand:- start:912 stop:1049 length:138 start_codon:yes stop_codon:yes gene_type:complete
LGWDYSDRWHFLSVEAAESARLPQQQFNSYKKAGTMAGSLNETIF